MKQETHLEIFEQCHDIFKEFNPIHTKWHLCGPHTSIC